MHRVGVIVKASRATISGNTVFHNGNDSDSGAGIVVSGADSIVSGNDVYDETTGIVTGFYGAMADRIIVSGNTIRGGKVDRYTGIDLHGASLASGNTVFGQGQGTGAEDPASPLTLDESEPVLLESAVE